MSEDNDYEYEKHSAHVINPTVLSSKWRVKLYHLNEEGQWDDMGTGYVSISRELLDKKIEYTIKMHSEANNQTMFELNLANGIQFNRQRGTILTWKTKLEEEDDDTAVSFQEKEGIREVWKFLCAFNGKDPHEELYCTEEDDEEILQEPTTENLSYIAREIRPELPPSRIAKIIDHVMSYNGEYIKRLGELLESEEKKLEEKKSEISKLTKSTDVDSKLNSQFDENLSLIFTIFKNLFFIADRYLIEFLMQDEFYLVTFGALEYDFESQKIIKHRQFLKDIVKFKNILNITDENLLNKIHLNHRLMYLRDTAIGRFIEEMTLKHINLSIHINNSEIIQYFMINKDLINKVISKVVEGNNQDKAEGISFLLELMTCCKDLLQNKIPFYEVLCDQGILEMLEKTLVEVTHYSNYNKYLNSLKHGLVLDNEDQSEENSLKQNIKINALEILINILTIIPHTLKNHIIFRNKEHTLLTEMCNILIHQENFGIKYEIGEILKCLLDNEVTEKKTEFYDLFYNKCLKKLVDFIEVPLKYEFRYEMISSKQIIIEIICHCMKQHGNRIRYWAIHNNLISKIFNEEAQPKILQLQSIKFLKSVIINNDDNLNKVVIYNDAFAKVIKIFEENRDKGNLVVSAILDLFDYVKNNLSAKKIISYLFEKHWDFFYDEKNKKLILGLVLKYEQGMDQYSGDKLNAVNKEIFRGYNSREESERENEDYFNEDEDDEDDKIFPNEMDSNVEDIKDYLGKKRSGEDLQEILESEKYAIYEGFNKMKRNDEDEEDFDNIEDKID